MRITSAIILNTNTIKFRMWVYSRFHLILLFFFILHLLYLWFLFNQLKSSFEHICNAFHQMSLRLLFQCRSYKLSSCVLSLSILWWAQVSALPAYSIMIHSGGNVYIKIKISISNSDFSVFIYFSSECLGRKDMVDDRAQWKHSQTSELCRIY